MKRYIYAALLASTTALYPTKAHAMPPVVAFIGGVVSALGAPALGGALAGLGAGVGSAAFGSGLLFAGTGFTGALLSAGLKIGLSFGISALIGALQPSPQIPPPAERMVNLRQPISDMEIVYGQVRKGGPVSFWQAKDGKRYYDILVAAHEVNSYTGYYADERDLTLNASGYATNSEYQYNGSTSAYRVKGYTGATGDTAPDILQAAFTEVTAAHDYAGLAHITAVAANVDPNDFQDVYPSSREPTLTPLVEGKKVYDPRDVGQDVDDESTWEYTTNAALIIADWCTSVDGLNRGVDWDEVAEEADVADTSVTDRNSNSIAKWTLNGTYQLGANREAVRANLGVACDAFFYERSEGKVGFKLGRYITPTVTITDNHILSAAYSEGAEGTSPVNACVVQYTEPTIGYVEAPSAAIEISAPNEPYEVQTISDYWIQNHNQACRVAKRILRVQRAEWRASMVLKLEGARLIGQRFFRLTHEEMDLDVIMEVDKLVRNKDGITYSVECHSVTAADFDFNAATEEPEPPKRTKLVTESTVPEPTNVTATGVAGGLEVPFDAPPRGGLLTQIRVRVQDAGGSPSAPGEWYEINVPAGQTSQIISGLDTVVHEVQARHITGAGNASDWAPSDGLGNPTITATPGISVPLPSEPVLFSATGGSGQVELEFTTANDPYVAGTSLYRSTTNDEGTAGLIGTEYSGANVTLVRIDDNDGASLPAGTYYYWARGINTAGNESDDSIASGAATVT